MAYGRKQVLAGHLLEDIPRRTGHDRGKQGLIIVKGRENDRSDGRIRGADMAANLDAVAIGEAGVEDCYVRPQRRNTGDC